ncbi:MAG TPA: chemotaxis protein CheA [Myxococcota bacterium]|nr:chemotaxis protein CheA [Myxococcota bacterium]
MDLAKYRAIFIEESTEHFAEISQALLELEKDPARVDAIDVVFRMAHSIKGMAASLGYDSITELAHKLEDRMQLVREAGVVEPREELSVLFRGLTALEAMVGAVRETGEAPPADPELVSALAARSGPEAAPKKKRAEAPGAARRSSAPAPRLEAPRPPPTVRVNTRTLDRFLSTVGEVILNTSQVRTVSQSGVTQNTALTEGLDRMDRVVGELQRRALELRTTPLLRILEPLPRAARDVAERAGVRVEVQLRGAELELDRSILDRLSDPLVHLLRNAVDHGIEPPDARIAAGKPAVGRIVIEARRDKDTIRLSVSDDGSGIDLDGVRRRAQESGVVHPDLAADLTAEQIAALVFEPGLSTASEVSEISGRGVGMDAVRSTLESLGGAVEIATEPGRGTTTTLVVPITAAVQRVLLLGVGAETVAIPIAKVERIEECPTERIERAGSDAFALIDGDLVPVLDLASHIAQPAAAPGRYTHLVLTEVRGERVALSTERVAGQQQIYVKPLPELLRGARALSGLTILGDGRPMFLLDPNQIA